MSTEENKALVHRAYEETMNRRNLAVLDELAAPDSIWHTASRTLQGLEAFKQFCSMYLSAFPDLHYTIEDQIAEGDKVVTRYTARGTHKGALFGIPPTGKQVTVTGIDISRFADGKVVEHWGSTDNLGLPQQLGVVPLPE